MRVVVRGVTVSMDEYVWVKLTPLGAGLWTQWALVPASGALVVPFWQLMVVFGPHVRNEERKNELFSQGEITFLAETEHEVCLACQAEACRKCGGTGRMLV